MEEEKTTVSLSASESDNLRSRAQSDILEKGLAAPDISQLSREQLQNMVQELLVHQVELEMQCHELHETQGQLIEAKDKLLDLYDFAPVGYLTISNRGIVLEANLNAAILLSVPRTHLIGRPLSRFVFEDDADEVHFLLMLLSKNLTKHMCDVRMIRPDGGKFHALLVATPIFDTEGRLNHLKLILTDITDRKVAENELLESEKKYKDLTESLPQGIFECDTSGKITFANPAFRSICGVGLGDDLIGIDFPELIIPEERPKAHENIQNLINGQILESIRNIGFRKDGNNIAVLINTAPFFSGGEVCGFRGVVTDISSLKQAERERNEFQDQLSQAQNMAYLGSLVGSIAHDFKNMLQAIIGYTEIATDYDHDPSRQRSSLEEITECIREGAELVNNLLAFGRRSPVFPASVNLNDELVTLSKLIRLTLSNITQIEMDLMDEPARIEVDRSLLKHLIMNLAINSSEAMPNGGSLKISTSKISLDEDFCRLRLGTKPGSYVMLTVTDTGRGMDSHTLHRIFLPYFSTKPEGNSKGVGMGLSVVRGVAELHGGFVTCDSEIGNGSSFKVYFPDVEALASTSELTTPLSRSIAKNTILLVEDSVPVSELGEKFLKKAGYNTIVANNGKRAINIFRKKKADIGLVILDLIMPGMNGKDTLMELLKIDSKVKAIAMTGCEPEHELARDIRPYVKEFLSKPCKMSDLVKTVRSLLPIQDPVGLQT